MSNPGFCHSRSAYTIGAYAICCMVYIAGNLNGDFTMLPQVLHLQNETPFRKLNLVIRHFKTNSLPFSLSRLNIGLWQTGQSYRLSSNTRFISCLPFILDSPEYIAYKTNVPVAVRVVYGFFEFRPLASGPGERPFHFFRLFRFFKSRYLKNLISSLHCSIRLSASASTSPAVYTSNSSAFRNCCGFNSVMGVLAN